MGLKRLRPNFWVRLKSGKKTGFATLGGTSSVAGTVIGAISATETVVGWPYILGTTLFCLASGVGAAYLRGKTKLLPDAFIDEMSEDGPYTCQCCTTDGLNEACEMTKPYYGNEYVPGAVAEQWRIKNPKAFMQIVNSKGEICAAFGVMALNDSFMDQFVAGRVSDTQMNEDCVKTLYESRKSDRLYLSGIVVKDPSTHIGAKRARVMMWAMLHYMKNYYGLRKARTLYAIGVTKESELLMKHLNFVLASEAANRIDKSNLYALLLTRSSWENLLAKVGDFSKMFTCHFD